jgi:uncharacterized protein (DUF362 family)
MHAGKTMKKNTPKQKKFPVALTRCDNYSEKNVAEAINRQFELLGGIDKFIKPGKTVLLKPNFIVPRAPQTCAQTDPAIVIETAKIVKQAGAKCIVGDSPAWNTVTSCAKKLNLIEKLKALNVQLTALKNPVNTKLPSFKIPISKTALEADAIINLPKLKTHQQLNATFAIKNMFGVVPGKRKAFYHFSKGKSYRRFTKMLLEIYDHCRPTINIIDGVTAMQGQGPISGQPRKLGVIIGSIDPIAAELVCCKITNIEPDQLPIINQAAKLNLYCHSFDHIEILGDDCQQFICPDFIQAQLTELRFTFPRICKSVSKQILIIAKSAFSKT